jgi:hypothetical protein
MKELHNQQGAAELYALTEADVESVSGGAFDVDLGPLGIFRGKDGCFEWILIDNSTKSWISIGQC